MANNPRARDNLIPAKPGEVRNPKGKPKGVPNSKTRLLRLLELTENLKNPVTGEMEGFTVAEQLDMQQIIKARRGDTKAYQTIMDRLEGKPAQSVDVTTGGEKINKIKQILEASGLAKEVTERDGQARSITDGTPESSA